MIIPRSFSLFVASKCCVSFVAAGLTIEKEFDGLCLPKCITLHLLIFSFINCFLHHSVTAFRSLCNDCAWLSDLICAIILLSSAYNMHLLFSVTGRSFMYIMNRIGSNTLHCENHECTNDQSDSVSPKLSTLCLRPVMMLLSILQGTDVKDTGL